LSYFSVSFLSRSEGEERNEEKMRKGIIKRRRISIERRRARKRKIRRRGG
jgi:hypothetical protein